MNNAVMGPEAIATNRAKAVNAVLRNLREFGTPDAPGLETHPKVETGTGTFRLFGANLLRACAYTREHPLEDGRFLSSEYMDQKGLHPSKGVSPLLIEEATMEASGFGIRMHEFYPASHVPGAPEKTTSQPLESSMQRISSFLTEKGFEPADASSPEDIYEELYSYAMTKEQDVPRERRGAVAGLFAWQVMRDAEIPYDGKSCPALSEDEIERFNEIAFLESSHLLQDYALEEKSFRSKREESIRDTNTNANPEDPFEGFSIIFHWIEKEPIRLPEQETSMPYESENVLFQGKAAYEFLVGLLARDIKVYNNRICIPGYDKCEISVHVPTGHGDALDFHKERIDLGDLSLLTGDTPMESLRNLLGGTMYQKYYGKPDVFGESVWYRMMREDAEREEKPVPTPEEALASLSSEWEQTMDAFALLIEKEKNYLPSHPKLLQVIEQKPELFYALVPKNKLPERFTYLNVQDANQLDGLEFERNNGTIWNDMLFSIKSEELPPSRPVRNRKGQANGYVLVASPFSFTENTYRGYSFHPYLPREYVEKLKSFLDFELKVTTHHLPGTMEYERAETNVEYFSGINAMEELCECMKASQKYSRESRRNGFAIANGTREFSLSYRGKEYMTFSTVPGQDDNFLKAFGEKNDGYFGFPMPEEKDTREALWEGMKTSIRVFQQLYDHCMPSYFGYDVEKEPPIPTGKEAEENFVQYMSKMAEKQDSSMDYIGTYDTINIARIIETGTRMFMMKDVPFMEPVHKARKERKTSENQLLGMGFTLMAAKFGFNRNNIKRLINYSRLSMEGSEAAMRAMRLKPVVALLKSRDSGHSNKDR